MTDYKKLYIKFIEGDEKDLQRACKLAEKLGYKKLDFYSAFIFEGKGILFLDNNGDYCTSVISEEELIKYGCTEYKEEYKEEFIRGELVEVSDGFGEWEKRIYLTTIEGTIKPYVCVADEESYKRGEMFHTNEWEYIRKIQQPKTITITYDGKKLEITEEKAKELGFNIN